MNINATASSIEAIRRNGSCRGSLWKQQVQNVSQSRKTSRESTEDSRKTFEYCVLCGVLFVSYADYNSFRRGDHPTNVLRIVGASAFKASTTASEVATAQSTFRMVTYQGTHIYCTAPTPIHCNTWLAALHSGLEASYSMSIPEQPILKPPSMQKLSKSRGMFRDKQIPCTSCGRVAEMITLATPLPQYGYETRCHVCPECLVSQGVWLDIHHRNQLYASYKYERDAFQKARDACYILLNETTLADIDINEAAPAIISKSNVLRDLISNPGFCVYRRLSPRLEKCCSEFELGELDAVEFVELLDDTPDTEITELKKQAFRVAGDMGSAMKLLAEYTLSGDFVLFKHILDFLLDLCDEGDLSSVAFFWPQLQCLHLQMLPPNDCSELIQVELMEDFLLTVAIRHSVQLALELVWGYVADLEDSLFHTNISPSTRRRRFSVLRFVCELESLVFDFQGGWGGGSVSLRNMLTPSPHQVALLCDGMSQLAQHRRDTVHIFLSRSARMDKLRQAKFTKRPEEAAEDALKAAKNADYFSSHLSFTRRICDIAEKLRFLEIEERASALEHELRTLNASGSMGGDPLNLVTRDNLLRVVRVPSTEGHVFRSKERTPILLLMEVVKESDPQVNSEKDIDEILREQSERHISKDGPSEQEANHRRATHYAVDLEMPPELNDSENSTRDSLKPDGGSVSVDDGDEEDHVDLESFERLVKGMKNQQGAKPVRSRLQSIQPTSEEKEPMHFYKPDPMEERPGSTQLFDQDDEPDFSPLDAFMDPIHHSPRALARFRRFDAAENGDDTGFTDPKTPSKEAMEQLVTDVMIQQLDIPTLTRDEVDQDTQGEPGVEISGLVKSASKLSLCLTNRKMGALGDGDASTLLGSEDIRRNVLTTIMTKGMKGSHAIAAGAAMAAQKSLQELDRKRAVEMILNGEDVPRTSNVYKPPGFEDKEREKAEMQRQQLIALCMVDGNDLEVKLQGSQSEEDEAIESLRLLLIQNQKSKGSNTTYTSLRSVNAPLRADGTIDKSEVIEIDAGDVDPRLEGCGTLPPAVLSALTLWKGGVVTTAELLELVKKDLQFIRQSDNPNDSQPDNSAFWGRFAFGERWAEKKARISATSPEGSVPGWDLQGVIVKSNDDLRQEAFIMQLIELCREAFELAGLELWVHPYRILATGRTTGIIECVKNAMSFDALKKRRGYKDGLRGHLRRMAEFSPNPGEAFNAMQHNFVRSLASYSLMSYLFLVKDRHNGNILLDTAGHVIHIDFGFVFGIAPGGSFSLEMSTPFKMTEEMLEVMGGMQSPFFSEFVTQFCCGFVALRTHMDTFLTLVEITCSTSSFKCFEGREPSEVVEKMRTRFCPDLSNESAVAFAMDLIKQSTQSYGTKQYDYFQYLSQGIAA